MSVFDANQANDTATWCVNGTVFGRQHYTTQYHINGTGSPLSTKRYYETMMCNGNLTSFVAVWFTGFLYNISTGLSFDPEFILYNSILHNPPVVPEFLIIIMPAITIIALFIVVNPTKKSKIFRDS